MLNSHGIFHPITSSSIYYTTRNEFRIKIFKIIYEFRIDYLRISLYTLIIKNNKSNICDACYGYKEAKTDNRIWHNNY